MVLSEGVLDQNGPKLGERQSIARVFALLTPDIHSYEMAQMLQKPLFALRGCQRMSVNTLLCDTLALAEKRSRRPISSKWLDFSLRKTKMDQHGPFWPKEVYFGLFRSANRTLATPEKVLRHKWEAYRDANVRSILTIFENFPFPQSSGTPKAL